MNFDKKTLVEVSSVLVITLVLGLSAVSVDASHKTMISQNSYGILASAGASAAISDAGNVTVAGANGALDESVGVVSVENVIVGQGMQDDTYGYTNLGLAVVDGNLNIRKEASASGSIVGKMTNYAACEILGEENGFYKVKTGNAEGYVYFFGRP